ncbi:MAG: extracellular solute-binding protein [Eubacteriales bacterium]|nr:extracellular solute-binding protein [Eubacteriales bacterium]
MNKLYRFLAVALIAMMCLTAFPVLAEEERPTLTVFLEECSTVEDFETNEATLWIQDQIGAELDFIIAPLGSAEEKVNILLNSGDYPDIFYCTVPNENLYGVEAGLLADLTEYIDNVELMPNLNHLFELRPNLKNQLKATDGKIYSFPAYTECYHCQFNRKLWYNGMQLEALGLEAPTTIDEFYNAMVAYKQANPDGIALTGCNGDDPFAFIINAWTYYPSGDGEPLGLRLHEGKVETMINTDEYREALRFLNKLYTEGLLYEGTFTMDGTQLSALLAQEGEPVLFWSAYHNVTYVNGANTPELYAHEEGLAPLMGPDGAQYTTYTIPAAKPAMAISNTCENIEKAVAMADLHYSTDGHRIIADGVEGVNWRWCEEGEMSLLGNPGSTIRVGEYVTDVQNFKWEPRCMQLDVDELVTILDIGEFDWDDPSNGIYVRFLGTKQLYAPYYQDEYTTIPAVKFTGEEEEDLALLSVSLESYLADSRVSFITGKLNLDSDWDAYVKSIEGMGMSDVIDMYQMAYDRAQ